MLDASTLDVSNDKITSLLVLDDNNDLNRTIQVSKFVFVFDYLLNLPTTNVPSDNSVIDGKNQVRIQLPIIWEERLNHYVFHAEGFDPYIEQDDTDDMTNFIKGNNHDEIFYHLYVEKLKHKWKQNSTDAFTHLIKKFAPATVDVQLMFIQFDSLDTNNKNLGKWDSTTRTGLLQDVHVLSCFHAQYRRGRATMLSKILVKMVL